MPEEPRTKSFTADASHAGQRLDRVLVALLPGTSRSRLQSWIRDGRVAVGGRTVTKPGSEVTVGDELVVMLPERPAPAPTHSGSELVVLFEDEHLIVIDKPAGMLTHPSARSLSGTVADLAQARFGPLPEIQGENRPGIVHRLDRWTSGVMVLGRTMEVLEDLKRQFQERKVEKTYLALVHGAPRFDTEWIETAIGRPEKKRDRQEVVPDGLGREAVTYFEVRERFHGFTYVACLPKTGRTHQIRVHMTFVGLPLVGDRLYRPRGAIKVPLPDGSPRIDRQALHAQSLALTHPVTGRAMRFEAPLPDDMQALLAWLRENMPATDDD